MPGADAARETSSNKVPNLPPSVFSKISSPDNAAASMRMKASLNCNRFVVASRFMSDGDGGAEESTTLPSMPRNVSSLAMVSYFPYGTTSCATKLSFK